MYGDNELFLAFLTVEQQNGFFARPSGVGGAVESRTHRGRKRLAHRARHAQNDGEGRLWLCLLAFGISFTVTRQHKQHKKETTNGVILSRPGRVRPGRCEESVLQQISTNMGRVKQKIYSAELSGRFLCVHASGIKILTE